MEKIISNFFILLFFGAVILGLHFVIYKILVNQGVMSLKGIYVSGNRLLQTGNIIESSGISRGIGIFDFSLQELAANICTNRLVEFAEVKRYPPDSLEIKIKERQPVCAVSIFNNFYMCDKNGHILMNGYYNGFPVIIPDFDFSYKNDEIKDEYIKLVLNKLYNVANLNRINKIYIKKIEGIYITLKNLDGTLFFIGKNISDNDIFNKIFSVADKIISDNLKIKFIDINKENAIGFK